MHAVATMTDAPGPEGAIAASAAERLAALRQPSTSNKRTQPATTSKILSAGISTTALFGLIAAMGWQTGTGVAQSASAPLETPPAQVSSPTPVTPTVAPLVPTTGTVSPAVAAVPTTIPVAVPAAQPAPTNSRRVQSNATTKSSG